MFYHASIIKEIRLATFLIDTFVIVPLDDELFYEKGENITHFAFEHRENLLYNTSLSEKVSFPCTSFAKHMTEKTDPENSH